MAIVEYHLYRVKSIKSPQLRLLSKYISQDELFTRVLAEKPMIELRQGSIWHIGNIQYLNEMSGFFAVGRTTKTTLEKYDESSGNFIEEIDDSGPYTFVLFDRRIGLLGIAKKAKVVSDVFSIARKIKGLFEKSRSIIK